MCFPLSVLENLINKYSNLYVITWCVYLPCIGEARLTVQQSRLVNTAWRVQWSTGDVTDGIRALGWALG